MHAEQTRRERMRAERVQRERMRRERQRKRMHDDSPAHPLGHGCGFSPVCFCLC